MQLHFFLRPPAEILLEIFASPLSEHSLILQRKNSISPSGQVTNPLKFKEMKTTATTTTAATANATSTAKTKKRTRKSAAKKEATAPVAPEQKPEAAAEATAQKSKLLVFKRSRNNGFYVYLLGVMPDENIGCNCRTPQSAMRFMLWKKRELGASISEQHFNELKQLAAAEG